MMEVHAFGYKVFLSPIYSVSHNHVSPDIVINSSEASKTLKGNNGAWAV
jgi:hypothetical protein